MGILALSGAWWWQRGALARACAHEARDGNAERAVSLCRDAYEESGDEQALLWVAKSHLNMGQLQSAEDVARRLLAGKHQGSAHQILCYCAMRDGATAKAMAHARLAIAAHTAAGDEAGLVADETLLSQAAWQAGEFATALEAADRAIARAQRCDDASKIVNALIARTDALRRTGDYRLAMEAARRAIDFASSPRQRAWTHLKHAMVLAEDKQEARALHELEIASGENQRGGDPILAWQIALNEAPLLRHRDPAGASARLNKVEDEAGEAMEIWLLRAYLAADRGDLAEADRALGRAEECKEPDADWRWEVVLARAQLAELGGQPYDLMNAELYYRRAVAMVSALRSTAQARSAYFVSSHRGPYDGLLSLLARQGRWRDVLAVVLELDASDMLRATAEPNDARERDTLDIPSAPAPKTEVSAALVEQVLAAWRGRDLVIVVAEGARQIAPGSERAYRLRLRDGEVTGQDVGLASDAHKWVAALDLKLSDQPAAQSLGQLIVPPDGTGTLEVLAVGPLGKAPLAPLRAADGRLIIASRPLARVLALRARRPPSPGNGAPVVLADPGGTLANAATEGALVAARLRAKKPCDKAQSGDKADCHRADKASLWAASDAALFHFAGHVDARGQSRVLLLADGEVSPQDLLDRGFAPRLAVLAACGSAAATDEEGWGSIAAALLEAGTAHVVATNRTVGDRESLELMKHFYEQEEWRTDPARSLARAQLALAQAPTPDPASGSAVFATSWAAFSVLARPPYIPDSASTAESESATASLTDR